jgi:hypothetical protein
VGIRRFTLVGTRNKAIEWQHEMQRLEALETVLQGNAEFEASDVALGVSSVLLLNP